MEPIPPAQAPLEPVLAYTDKKTGQSFTDALFNMKEALIAFSLIMSFRYLLWRAAVTLNFASPLHSAVSVTLFAAEIYGFVSILLYYFQALRPVENTSAPLEESELPTVDILVTIYNEPTHILYRTLVCCEALDYPKDRLKIYVCDDGGRAAVKALADKFGFGYTARADRLHAKAGNLNNGMKFSSGELVVTLDTDHLPVRSFLRETVGFFSDRKVALVQLPHHFYNPDVFQHNLHLDNDLVHEQDLFFQVIQPGRQRSNSVMYAGSSSILRRSALEAIGGFQTDCAIEDTHTSMRLHAKGFRAIYYKKILSGALSPESFQSYLTQRKRWTRGGVQLFILDNPFLCPGLSPLQRIAYFSSVLYFFHGWSRLVYLLAPLSFLIGDLNPIVADTWTLVGYFLPHYVFCHLAFILTSREFRNPFWSDVYEAASVFSLSWTALAAVLKPEKLVFHVTPKGEKMERPHKVHWEFVIPHIVLLGLLLSAVIVATNRIMNSPDLTLNAYTLSCAWAVFNVILLGCAVEGARERPQLRGSQRIPRRIPCELSYHGKVFEGTIRDISESGALVVMDERDHMPPLVHLKIFPDGADGTSYALEQLQIECEVIHQELPLLGTNRIGMRFTDMDGHERDRLIRRMFSPPDAWSDHFRPFTSSWTAFWHIASSVLRVRVRRRKPQRRARARMKLNLSCTVDAAGVLVKGELRDISVIGARVLIPTLAGLPPEVELQFSGTNRGLVEIRAQTVRSAVGDKRPPEFGLRFLKPRHIDPVILEELEDVTSG